MSEIITPLRAIAFSLACGLHIGTLYLLPGLPQPPNFSVVHKLASVDFIPYDPQGRSREATPPAATPAPAPPPPLSAIESASSRAERTPARPRKPLPAPTKSRALATAAAQGKAAASGEQERSSTPPGAGQGTADQDLAWRSYLFNRINAARRYPAALRARRLTGQVKVNFTLHRSGHVAAVRIIQSSGHPALDREVLALFKRISPFKPVPPALANGELTYTISIRFVP
jgi:protein TonB